MGGNDMTALEFMERWNADDRAVDGKACLQALLEQMDEGLAGRGRIPMLPSYLRTEIAVPEGAVCAVLDAGGTNLRTARAVWDGQKWELQDLRKQAMPGTVGELSHEALYAALAAPVQELENSTGWDSAFLIMYPWTGVWTALWISGARRSGLPRRWENPWARPWPKLWGAEASMCSTTVSPPCWAPMTSG